MNAEVAAREAEEEAEREKEEKMKKDKAGAAADKGGKKGGKKSGKKSRSPSPKKGKKDPEPAEVAPPQGEQSSRNSLEVFFWSQRKDVRFPGNPANNEILFIAPVSFWEKFSKENSGYFHVFLEINPGSLNFFNFVVNPCSQRRNRRAKKRKRTDD